MGKGDSERSRDVTVSSEDAPVNTGAATGPSESGAFVAVRKIQNKLHCWASTDRARRFDDLYNLVSDPKVLAMAWERVAGNQGARTAGVDRATVAWIVSRYGVDTFLHEIRDQLQSQTFTPAPVRRVMIPKASGKLRASGIPTVTDRVVQAALKLVLEPIFEADFASVSYGFRPDRRAQDAIAEIHHFTTKSYQWVLEADIEACFDNIDHTALMDRLRARIKDKRVLALVKSFLKAGVLTATGSREGSITGTPQGGILSPLAATRQQRARCGPASVGVTAGATIGTFARMDPRRPDLGCIVGRRARGPGRRIGPDPGPRFLSCAHLRRSLRGRLVGKARTAAAIEVQPPAAAAGHLESAVISNTPLAEQDKDGDGHDDITGRLVPVD